MKYLNRHFFKEQKQALKEKGFKEYFKDNGWKILLAVILFYLVRDTILYIIIPYLVINQIISP